MALLVVGIVFYCLLHLFPATQPAARASLQQKLGENTYRGLFSLFIIGSLVIIVFGWKSASPSPVYSPPMSGNIVSAGLVLVGLVLFFASQTQGNIKRFVRHPQMTGTIFWGVAHLLVNGDSRSIALFGGLTLWAVAEITLINRRDGKWDRPGPAAIKNDLIPLAVGILVFAGVAHFHATLFGVSAFTP